MLNMSISVLKGLEYIHSMNVLHLDIKPKNILVVKGVVKICDFGASSNVPVAGGQRGTYIYMAPELFINGWASEHFTQKCDIWSFGITILGEL